MIAFLYFVRNSVNHYTLNLNKSFLAVTLNFFKVEEIKLYFMYIIKTYAESLVLFHFRVFSREWRRECVK